MHKHISKFFRECIGLSLSEKMPRLYEANNEEREWQVNAKLMLQIIDEFEKNEKEGIDRKVELMESEMTCLERTMKEQKELIRSLKAHNLGVSKSEVEFERSRLNRLCKQAKPEIDRLHDETNRLTTLLLEKKILMEQIKAAVM
ncbi:uncharacterized protein LOC133798731 isoform X1 [Humulus lupulus]|uniref:uncharacterized protein LOC133798731 isoform X1 n=2 Tax=Humulus lupulus TaxID=3486 RepID=UPI002B406ED3|nr:uncharacterized protein LOC133798731 isoform X1 [Humulus lupulus]